MPGLSLPIQGGLCRPFSSSTFADRPVLQTMPQADLGRPVTAGRHSASWWVVCPIVDGTVGPPADFPDPTDIHSYTHPPFPQTHTQTRAEKKRIVPFCLHCGSERIHRATWGVSQDSGPFPASCAGSASCAAAASSPALIVHVVG